MTYKKWMIGILMGLSIAATAQPYGGTVYGVYPEGVMINQGGYSYLVPNQHATFEIGGLRATWTTLQPGQAVRAILPPSYYPTVQRIPDPYAWKMKYHPTHPHGGPPGQMKKAYPNNGKGKGNNGNGKGKNK